MVKQATRWRQGSPLMSTTKAKKNLAKAREKQSPTTTFGGSSSM